MAATPSEGGDHGNSEQPLTYKTWVLKVSIHCEGCKRKVRRILHGVEGVYTIDVDTRQHKVIVTGNVDANTLIKKLEKSGKHAELWPDFQKIPNNSQRNEELSHQEQQQANQNQNQNQNANVEEPHKNNGESQQGTDNSGQHQQRQQQQQGDVVKEVRFEGNIPAAGDTQKPPGNNAGGGGNGGGGGKKKKKKKGNSSNNPANNSNSSNNNNSNNSNNNVGNNNNGGNGEVASTEHGAIGEPQSTESHPPQQHPNPNTKPGPVNMSPPRYPANSRVYEYPPAYYAPPPVYGVSYNTAYPSSSYSASYYSAPPPNSYAFVHQGGDVEPPAPFDWNPHAAPPSDSFEMFSDENPNACSIM